MFIPRRSPPVPASPDHGGGRPGTPALDHRDRQRRRWANRGFGLLWAAALVVPLLAVIGAGALAWRDVTEEARVRLERTVDMLQQHALRAFATQEAIITAVQHTLADMDWDEARGSTELHRLLANLAGTGAPLVGGIVVVDPGERMVASSSAFPAPATDLSGRDYLAEIRAGERGLVVGEAVATLPQGRSAFAVARAQPDNGIVGAGGAVVSSFAPEGFAAFYRGVVETPRDSIALIRNDGRLLVRVPDVPALDPEGEERLATWLGRAPADGGPFGFMTWESGLDGIRRFYAARQVGRYPVFVVYGLDEAALIQTWRHRMTPTALGGLAAAALLLGLTALAQRGTRREREAAERRLMAEAQLARVGHAATIGLLAAGLAHDFKNLVQAVRSGARLMERRAEDPTEIRRCAALLSESADRGNRLVEGMLAFARSGRGVGEGDPTAPLDVGAALQQLDELLNRTLGSGYRVELSLPPRLPLARGDRAGFESAIVNLAANARDAMPHGGKVSIAAWPETVSEAPEGDGTEPRPGRYIAIAVEDHGEGMDPETLARVGEAFFTTKPAGQGTGLGLATVRGFVEGAGGAFRLRSALGEGTVATILLPCVEGHDA